jgi:hypothetical protein
MVSKCANPSCLTTFRYLREGRLFHLAVGAAAVEGAGVLETPALEHFWLCGECSSRMTLVSHSGGVLVVPLQDLSEKQEQQRSRSTAVGALKKMS